MPNLDHDPQNPTDLLGRPIDVGDIVAWGTTYGRSAALAVCVIEKIRFIRKEIGRVYDKNIECDQSIAEDYQLVLRPIKSTGGTTWIKPDGEEYREYRDGPVMPPGTKAKPKTVHLVKNVVKLEPIQ
jgi:hypothetical protein